MGQFMQFVKYAMYIPLLVQLIASIRAAQATWKGAGTGEQKARWVADQFSVIVGMLQSVGLIGKQAAEALRGSSLAIITAVVQVMKDVQGEVPPLEGGAMRVGTSDATGGGGSTQDTGERSFDIDEILTTKPADSDIRSGEDVYQHGEDAQWVVRRHDSASPALVNPWRLVRTVK